MNTTVNANGGGGVNGTNGGLQGLSNGATPPPSGSNVLAGTGLPGLSLDDLADLQKVLDSLGTTTDNDGSAPPGPPGPPGAPALSPPSTALNSEDLAIMCQNFMTKMSDLQMATTSQMLKVNDQQRQDAHKLAIEQIHKIAEKIAAAAKKQKMLGILGVIGKVFAVVAAAAMTLMTAGAAAPLAAVLLAYAVVDLTMTVADKISQANGGPSLSLDTLMADGIAKLAEKAGKSPEEAKKIGQWGAMAIQIAIAVASIACGIGSLVAGGESAFELSAAAMKATKIVSAAGMVVNGANMLAQGSLTVAQAFDDKDVAHSRAIQAREQAVIDILGTYIDTSLDRLKSLVAAQAQQQGQVSDILQSGNQTRLQVTHSTV